MKDGGSLLPETRVKNPRSYAATKGRKRRIEWRSVVVVLRDVAEMIRRSIEIRANGEEGNLFEFAMRL